MNITVVVPTFNEEDYICLLLGDLASQTVGISVVVSDCDSTDKTQDKVRSYSDKLDLRLVSQPIRSASSARNEGCKDVETEYVLFLDADTRVDSDFVVRLQKYVNKHKPDFLSPRLKSVSRHPFDMVMIFGVNLWVTYWMYLRRVPMGAGGAMLVRKTVHDVVGGYSPEIREFDDIDYCNRISRFTKNRKYACSVAVGYSSRRSISQGRLFTMLQGISSSNIVSRKIIRPIMRSRGLK
jgi:glycosyltransferase involved in cell wall biosynthesis